MAKEDGFSVYRVTPAGLGPAGPGLSDLSGVKAVAVGRAGRVYLVFADRVRCYVPSGTGYTESASGVLAVPGVTAISADPGSGAVIVAVGKAVRFFVLSGDGMAEVSRGCALPADVDGLALSPGLLRVCGWLGCRVCGSGRNACLISPGLIFPWQSARKRRVLEARRSS